jgi:hypothetical protein
VSDPLFMFSAPGHVFRGAEGVGSCFNVLCSRTCFRLYRGRRVSFSCFARLDSFSENRGRRLPFSCFFVPGLVFGGVEGVGFHSHVLGARSHFRRYRRHRVPFSFFVIPGTFSAVRRASGLDFIFCAPELVFGGTEGVGSRFHVLRAHTNYRWYRGRLILFSCFPLPDMF